MTDSIATDLPIVGARSFILGRETPTFPHGLRFESEPLTFLAQELPTEIRTYCATLVVDAHRSKDMLAVLVPRSVVRDMADETVWWGWTLFVRGGVIMTCQMVIFPVACGHHVTSADQGRILLVDRDSLSAWASPDEA